jgi:hypothetical protein
VVPLPFEDIEVVAAHPNAEVRYHPTCLVVGRFGPDSGGGAAEQTGVGPVLDVDGPDMAVREGDPHVVGIEARPHLDREAHGAEFALERCLGLSGPGDELSQGLAELA